MAATVNSIDCVTVETAGNKARGIGKGIPFSVSSLNEESQAAGTYQHVDKNQDATTSSPQDFKVHADCVIVDFIAGVDATGKVELYSDGNPTNILIDLASRQPDNAGRRALNIPLGYGKTYSFKVRSALSA